MTVVHKLISLKNVLEKIEIISNNEYNGETRLHIKEIFDRLNIREKKLILQAFVDMVSLMNKNFSDSEVTETSVSQIEEETDDINNFHKIEMVKLKIWLSKAIFGLLIIGVCFITTILYFIDPTTVLVTDRVNNFLKIVKVIIG